jgi:hypothetical protein
VKEYIGLIAIILAVLLVTLACQFGGILESGEEKDARTYYESLNLVTPEDAVQTFVKAFQRQDFMTVYLVFDAETQLLLRNEYALTLSWRHLIGEDADEGSRDDLGFMELFNTQTGAWYLFDQIMLYAAKKNDLLIDLRGDLDILRSEESKTGDGKQAVDVIADVDGVSGEVLFRMVIDRDSRWRVYLVSAPDEGVDSWPSTAFNESP